MNKTERENSAGTTFRSIPMKDRAPFGEHWIQVTRANGTTEGIGQFDNSFNGLAEAEAWIKKNKDDPKYL